MGCGESKHSVATTESFSQSRNSNSRSSRKRAQNADNQKGKKSISSLSSSSRGSSRSAAIKEGDIIEKTRSEREKNLGENEAEGIQMNEGKDKTAEEDVKEVQHERSVSRELKNENYYSGNEASEYETAMEEGGEGDGGEGDGEGRGEEGR
ncbi:hypothetical protein Ancab_013533 [Ancistrocladus abbreviatus]